MLQSPLAKCQLKSDKFGQNSYLLEKWKMKIKDRKKSCEGWKKEW